MTQFNTNVFQNLPERVLTEVLGPWGIRRAFFYIRRVLRDIRPVFRVWGSGFRVLGPYHAALEELFRLGMGSGRAEQ